MKKLMTLFIAGFGLWGCASMSCCTLADVSASLPAGTGQNMYDQVQLAAPTSKEAKDYLGLKETDAVFALSQTSSDVLIVEIFSVGCPYCQRESKEMSALFDLIRSSGLSEKIKMIGIGMTNSDFDITVFQNKFKIPFPLIADPDSRAYRFTGRVEIPHIFILKRDANGSYQRVYAKSRETEKAQVIWNTVLKVTGLKTRS